MKSDLIVVLKMNIINILAACLGLICLGFVEAEASVHGFKNGYIVDVEEEKTKKYDELVLISKPFNGPALKDVIFDSKLSKEFNNRYEETFGRTDTERNFQAPNRFAEREYRAGVIVTVGEDQARKKDFGNYIVKRLAEHHIDGYVKSNPAVRPIYEFKEKVSNVRVQVKKGYKVRIRYSYSGNFLMFRLENPYDIQTRLTVDMDSTKVGPADIENTSLYLSYPVDKKNTVATDYNTSNNRLSLSGIRQLTSSFSANLTAMSFDTSITDTNNVSRGATDNRMLIGLSWSN